MTRIWPGVGCSEEPGWGVSGLEAEVMCSGFQVVVIDDGGCQLFVIGTVMADDATEAVDGNIGVPAHYFRGHIHGELDAAADSRQWAGFEQKPVGGDISRGGVDHA